MIASIAFKVHRSMFPAGSKGSSADPTLIRPESKVSLSFYGKGPT